MKGKRKEAKRSKTARRLPAQKECAYLGWGSDGAMLQCDQKATEGAFCRWHKENLNQLTGRG